MLWPILPEAPGLALCEELKLGYKWLLSKQVTNETLLYSSGNSEWVEVAQSCPTLCDPMDYTVHGILQARTLEWEAFPFSRGSSQPRDRTQVSCIAGRFFTNWAIREPCGDLNGKEIKKERIYIYTHTHTHTHMNSWFTSLYSRN